MPLLRHLGVFLLAMALTALTAGCDNSTQRASLGGGVEPPAEAPVTASDPSTTSTALSPAALVLTPEGLGPVTFGTQAARAMRALTEALGQAETVERVPEGAACGATRIFRWKNLEVLVNEVSARSGGRPGLVGWSLGVGEPTPLDLKTDKGIGIGSPVAALQAAYGDNVSIVEGEQGPTLEITSPNGVMTGRVEGSGDRHQVQALRAGEFCNA